MMTAVLSSEARIQYRSGLTWLYLGMPALWILIARLMPPPTRPLIVIIGMYIDPVMMGSIFTGAFLTRERDQGLFDAWAVTPMDAGTWLAGRVMLISIQGTLGGFILALGSGVNLHPVRLLPALALASACGALTGLFLARPFRDIMSFFIAGGAASSVISLPVGLAYLYPSPIWLLTGPSWPGWAALSGALPGVPAGAASYGLSVASLAAWTAFLFILVRHMYHRAFFRRQGRIVT